MRQNIQICLLSNGRGEDRCAAYVAMRLSEQAPEIQFQAAPMVTFGEDYTRNGIDLITKGCCLPSGGFSFTSLIGFIRDVPYLPSHACYLFRLMRARRNTDYALVVGDITLLLMAAVGLRKPIIYIALAKSDYKGQHHYLEAEAMRRFAAKVFTRDAVTAESLRAIGIDAQYMGNPMMDGLLPMSPSDGHEPTLALLPGSRKEAYGNFKRLLNVAELVPQKPKGTCAIPNCLDVNKFRRAAISAGWNCAGDLISKNGMEVRLVTDKFDEVLANSDIILGMAGTANEQAAGLGKPVVSMPGCGPQTTSRRMRKQEKLMGGAIRFVRNLPKEVADEIAYLLVHPEEAQRRGQLGKLRMGPPGASKRIADNILEWCGLNYVKDEAALAKNVEVMPIGE